MSLAINYNELQKALSRYLGYGPNICGPDDGSSQWADIEDCIKSGLRQFYTPPILPGQDMPHQWSFLRPVAALEVLAGIGDYDMPADFGGIDGNLTYPAASGLRPVIVASEAAIRTLRQRQPQAANPSHAAIRPKATDGTAVQRFELMLWPAPAADTRLNYRYYVLPAALSQDNPYPYGSAAHAETILQSCLSIAEQRLNDTGGIHREKFFERLSASIRHDRGVSGVDWFGYNGDGSDCRSRSNDRLDYVTVNGVQIG